MAGAPENNVVPLGTPVARGGARPADWWQPELLELTHDAIIVWDLDGEGIVYWNRAAELLYGYTRDEARGRVTHELLKTQLAGGVGELEATLTRYGVWVGELWHTARDGRRLVVEARLALVAQPNGRWLVVEIIRDVTDEKDTQEALLEMQQRLEFALDNMAAGEWELDLATWAVTTSPGHDRCLGAEPPLQDWNLRKFLACVHAADRSRVEQQLRECIAAGRDWHCECRVVWPDGSVHGLEIHGLAHCEPDGSVGRIWGTVRHVAVRPRALTCAEAPAAT